MVLYAVVQYRKLLKLSMVDMFNVERVCVSACMCTCMRACVRACVCARVYARASVGMCVSSSICWYCSVNELDTSNASNSIRSFLFQTGGI